MIYSIAIITAVSFLVFGRAFTAYVIIAILILCAGGALYVLGWNPGHREVYASSSAPTICLVPDKNRPPAWQVYPPC